MRCTILLIVTAMAANLRAQPAALPAAGPIPANQLHAMYAAELGPFYDDGAAAQVQAAHELIERYFSAPVRERAQIVEQIGSTQIHADVLGRLTRLRMNWPVLAAGIYYVEDRVGPHQVRYFLGVPAGYDRSRSWPLVIRLANAPEPLSTPQPPVEQLAPLYEAWTNQELQLHGDALVLMPLPHPTDRYGPSYLGVNSIMQPMLHVADHANVDPARVYLMGHAMAAGAAWNIALHYPTYFAAFAAFAGDVRAEWQRVRLMNLGNVLPVVWHDTDDQVMKIAPMRQLVNILRRMEYDVYYEETRQLGHVPGDELAERLYQQMRGRTRELYPKQLALQSNRPDTLFNRADWMQLYQPFRSGSERRLLFRGGPGFMRVMQHSFMGRASIGDGNRIEVRSDNVMTMRLYFNDQMLDLSQPVTIIANRRPLYEGMIERNIAEMLKDQVFIGRGWRYYTAMVDISFEPQARESPPQQ